MRVTSPFARSSTLEAASRTPSKLVAAVRRHRVAGTHAAPQLVRLKPSLLAKLVRTFWLR
jgi:hypothetical protein